MPVEDILELAITYDAAHTRGAISRSLTPSTSTIWETLNAKVANNPLARISGNAIELPWPDLLDIVREYGSSATQRTMTFRFKPEGEAAAKIARFAGEIRAARSLRDKLTETVAPGDLQDRLTALGFRRQLRSFQLDDLARLMTLPHGANFSVPGAGKTTVTFALHLLVGSQHEHLFVVAPKAAFPAWREIVDECILPGSPNGVDEQFTVLDGSEIENDIALRSGHKRFLMSYDLLVRQQSTIANYLARQPTHLVLDESHRMKAGESSQRGAFLINIASLPVRRDILSGTPMPQDASDMASQLKFLWPGSGLGAQIDRGTPPRTVLGSLYVRTTKDQLGLPKAERHFRDVAMSDGQLALYGVVKNEILRQLTSAVRNSNPDFLSARKSVMRLLQLSSNPALALQAMTRDRRDISSGIADKVVEEGASTKMRAVTEHAHALAANGSKVVIWTIFTQSIIDMELLLADLNPVTLYGAVPSGDSDDQGTREGRIRRFHQDDSCQVMIANPAAAGEGISLHTVCHDAIYLDRSYNSTHYLQSIDRIHRLGLPPDTETNIYIYRTRAPAELGSVDLSVSRRLWRKISDLEQLLDDPDLRQLALDEQSADDLLDYDIDLQDLVDLVGELEGREPVDTDEA